MDNQIRAAEAASISQQPVSNEHEIVSSFAGHVFGTDGEARPIAHAQHADFEFAGRRPSMEARLFLSPSQGSCVQKTMDVAIAPVSVKKEEHGFMLRARVGRFAVSIDARQGWLGVLENAALVPNFRRAARPAR